MSGEEDEIHASFLAQQAAPSLDASVVPGCLVEHPHGEARRRTRSAVMDGGSHQPLRVHATDHPTEPAVVAKWPAPEIITTGTRELPEPAHEGPDVNEAVPAEASIGTGLFHDIPRSIWMTFLAGWAGFFLLMWLFFAVDTESTFAVVVAMLFGLMALGLPIVMARQSECVRPRSCEVIHTHTGPVTVRAAAAQIALIPIAVVIGLLGFIFFAK